MCGGVTTVVNRSDSSLCVVGLLLLQLWLIGVTVVCVWWGYYWHNCG